MKQADAGPGLHAAVRWAPLMAVLVGAAVGCGKPPYSLAPAEGVVTLDGQPLEGALVNTQPVALADSPNPGPGSFGKTDKEGRFSLELVSPQKAGAVVGAHRVRITKVTVKYAPGHEDAPIIVRNPLPEYASDGSLTMTVPEQGDNAIHFELNTRRRK